MSISPHPAPDDAHPVRVPLTPERNFRDLGGYETTEGAVVRRGAVYRSAHLHGLDDEDRERILALGIRTLCDLRGHEEGARRPGPFEGDSAVARHVLGVTGTRATGDPVRTILEYGITEMGPHQLVDVYRRFLERYATAYGRIVELCADPANHAVVVHCSAGKDRTGIASALLLSVLGVDDDTVVADYELTNELWSPHQLERAAGPLRSEGLDIERLRTYFLAPGEVMTATLEHLRERHGSVADYLAGPGGVSPDVLDRLADTLLTRP